MHVVTLFKSIWQDLMAVQRLGLLFFIGATIMVEIEMGTLIIEWLNQTAHVFIISQVAIITDRYVFANITKALTASIIVSGFVLYNLPRLISSVSNRT